MMVGGRSLFNILSRQSRRLSYTISQRNLFFLDGRHVAVNFFFFFTLVIKKYVRMRPATNFFFYPKHLRRAQRTSELRTVVLRRHEIYRVFRHNTAGRGVIGVNVYLYVVKLPNLLKAISLGFFGSWDPRTWKLDLEEA